MTSRQWSWLVSAVAIALLGMAGHFHVRQIVVASIQYDDAVNAGAAKNLARGHGYATSYHEVIPFDPNITTGPPVIASAAALIRVFGNRYWVPNLAFSLFVVLVYGLLAWVCVRTFHGFAVTVAAALVATRVTLHGASEEFGLLGEIPAAGFVAIAAVLTCRPSSRPLLAGVTAGVALALAVLTKTIAALAIPAFAALFAVSILAQSHERERRVAARRRVLGFVTGLALPFLAWHVWILASLGSWDAWLDANRESAAFFIEHARLGRSSDGPSLDERLTSTLARSIPAFLAHSGGVFWPVLFGAALILTAGALWAAVGRDRRQETGASLILFGAAVTHALWWFLLSRNDWLRYLLPGILYITVAIALGLGIAWRWQPKRAAVAGALLILSWYPHVRQAGPMLDTGLQPHPRLAALLSTTAEVQILSNDDDVELIGCGWWVARDVDYLLPRAGNFRDCFRLRDDEVSGRRLVLVRSDIFNWERSAPLDAFRAACERRVLFTQEPFVISECPGLWALTFPWAEQAPRRIREDQPFAPVVTPAGTVGTMAHATSVMAFDVAGGLKEIVIAFGLLDDSWMTGATDGVEFRILLTDVDGSTSLLWSRTVAPGSRAEDRGVLAARVAVPSAFQGGSVIAETLPGPRGDSRWDWAFWSRIELRPVLRSPGTVP